jgi:hypothetical protein
MSLVLLMIDLKAAARATGNDAHERTYAEVTAAGADTVSRANALPTIQLLFLWVYTQRGRRCRRTELHRPCHASNCTALRE